MLGTRQVRSPLGKRDLNTSKNSAKPLMNQWVLCRDSATSLLALIGTDECVEQRNYGSRSDSSISATSACTIETSPKNVNFNEVDDPTVSPGSRATLAVAPIPAERTATYPMVPWRLTWHMGTLASHGVTRFDYVSTSTLVVARLLDTVKRSNVRRRLDTVKRQVSTRKSCQGSDPDFQVSSISRHVELADPQRVRHAHCLR